MKKPAFEILGVPVTWFTAMTLVIALAVPGRLAAQQQNEQQDGEQEKEDNHHKHHHYKLIDVGTFGGPLTQFSQPSVFNASSRVMNSRGISTGWAETSAPDPFAPNCAEQDCLVAHTFVRKNGVTTDLGTLPSGASSFAVWINDRGVIAGESENGSIDPLTGFPEFAAVLWNNGQILNLGTLGGNQSIAYAINNRGHVVGGALNTAFDPFAVSPLPGSGSFGSFAQNFLFAPGATQTHAFLWQDEAMQDLGTLGGPDSAAELINDRGQVAGVSFTSSIPDASGVPTVDPFFWDNGKMIDVGTLGGTFGFPLWINNPGQVVGQSNTAGDNAFHPFLWDKKDGLKDLGTFGGNFGAAAWVNDAGEVVGVASTAADQTFLAFHWKNGVMTNLGSVNGDPCSQALSINSQGQIVVTSSPSCFNPAPPLNHAALSEDGRPMVDLNTLVSPGSGLTLTEAVNINDRGEIAVRGALPNGDTRAILLIPCDENHPEVEGCDYSLVDTGTAEQNSSTHLTQTHASTSQENTAASVRTVTNHFRKASRFPRFGMAQPSPK